MRIIIIGGVAGGASAATRLRRLSEKNEIIIFERGAHVSFANCGLPYFIGGVIEERDALLLQTPQSLKDRFNLDVRIKTEVLSIDSAKKTVSVKNLLTNEVYTESYDKLLLSPGAEPFRPNIKGIDSEKIMSLRTIADMDRIIANTKNAKKVTVIGGGYIGLEIAENLIERGIKVTMVERNSQIMTPVDFEMATIVQNHAREKGLQLKLNTTVTAFKTTAKGIKSILTNGESLFSDAVIMAVGVKPENKLAKSAGIKIGETGGIAVNDYLQTSNKDIYAVGDAIEVRNLVSQKKVLLPLAGPANRQGRIVADNMLNVETRELDYINDGCAGIRIDIKIKQNPYPYTFEGTLGTSIVKVFDYNIATTGLNEYALKENGIEYEVATVNRCNHAAYYPGANSIILKLLFGKDGTIYGAQAVGKVGVDKRIDVLATAIMAKLKVADLAKLQLAYAPPFNAAKDPVNIVGYVAENMLKGDLVTINYEELADYQTREDVVVLDVRTAQEYAEGAIPNAENLDINDIRANLDNLDTSKTYIVYCRVSLRSYLAHNILKGSGFKVLNLNGGYTIWNSVFGQAKVKKVAKVLAKAA